jgi:lipid-binding SYLF domain-containing protein
MLMLAGMLLLGAMTAHSDEYVDTIAVFRESPGSASFFDKSYGYAVFPTIGKAGLVVGGAHGTGRVYEKGQYVGDTSLTQLSVGFQAGGQAFSEIIFFENKAAFDIFTAGNFEMAATAQATAITASASASAGSTGASATASAKKDEAATAGEYYKGLSVFTVAKGGLMYEASIAGQKFTYKPRS